MTSHSEELSPKKLRMCNKCGKPFKSRCGLKLHMQTHDSEDMLNSCTFCDFKTPQKANLIKHLAVKHKKDNQVISFVHNRTIWQDVILHFCVLYLIYPMGNFLGSLLQIFSLKILRKIVIELQIVYTYLFRRQS